MARFVQEMLSQKYNFLKCVFIIIYKM
uniref:Uncharacterized protein n=1 Tax=Arundo donax TaxID=35708 RepID=A0A0A9B718_ARUDO